MTTRAIFLGELEKLNNDVIKMGACLEETIGIMIRALNNVDVELAKQAIARDDEVDALERKIEKECIVLIAKQQPVATDLRRVASIMKIITDLERIADHCSDISEYVISLSTKERMAQPSNLLDMIDAMKQMAVGVVTCFVKKDLEQAKKIIASDDIVDAYFRTICEELSLKMQKNPELVPQCIDYLMIIKYLERMADHSENIAEWVQYIVTGELL